MRQDWKKQNLELLAQRTPELYARILDNQLGSGQITPELIPCKTGNMTYQIQANGKPVYLHSRYDPLEEAERWAEMQTLPLRSVILFLGWGMGYQVLEWCKQHSGTACSMILWEPEPQFFVQSLPHVDLQPLRNIDNLEIVLGYDEQSLFQALHRNLSFLLNHELTIKPLPFVNIYPPVIVQTLKKQVQMVVALKQNALQYMETMGQACQSHIIGNLKQVPNCLLPHNVQQITTGRPGIIVAAGPSLNKNIQYLHAAQNKSVIFAVDTSFPVLRHHGIKPDFVVSKDPSDLNLKHFQNLQQVADTILAFEPQVHPEIPKKFDGKKIWIPARTNQVHQWLKGFQLQAGDHFPFSTNVALAAFNLAVVMGCNPIIFVGLDLCFSNGDGTSHVEHSALNARTWFVPQTQQLIYQREQFQESVQGISVEGIDGKQYPAIPNFFEALRLLESLIPRQRSLVIDATEGGAKIAGTTILSLQEALRQYCQQDISLTEVLSGIKPQCDHKQIQEALNAIAELLVQCRELADQALEQFEEKENKSSLFKELSTIRKKIEQHDKIYHVLENALERLIVEIDRPEFWSETSVPQAELVLHYHWYFTQIKRACELYAPQYSQSACEMANSGI
jgi:hypothetical protein